MENCDSAPVRRARFGPMPDMIIALLPTLAAAVWLFGARALVLTAVCVAACVAFEWGFCRVTKRPCTIGDFSAVVTGLILAFNLPAGLPYWMAVTGAFAAIVVTKGLFGGLGHNFANPALVGRIVLYVSFSEAMTTWPRPFQGAAELTASATPLALMRGGETTNYIDLFFGNVGGCMGETCAVTLLIGGVYLVLRGVIRPVIPLVYLATVAVGAALSGGDPLFHLLSGGLLLGAVFMATDPATSPAHGWGQAVFAFGCGVITLVIRLFGASAEGVSFALLFMNLITPYLSRAPLPSTAGGEAR